MIHWFKLFKFGSLTKRFSVPFYQYLSCPKTFIFAPYIPYTGNLKQLIHKESILMILTGN